MAQLTLDLPPETVAFIAKVAAERGVTVEAVAAEVVEGWAAYDDLDWEEDERRMAEPGGNIPLDEAFDRLEARVAAKRAARK